MLKKTGIVLGSMCILYFAIYAVTIGMTNPFIFVWLIMGISLTLISIFNRQIQRWLKSLPRWIKVPVFAIAAVCISAVLTAEALCIGYGARRPETGADYLIVLGAQVRGNKPTYSLARRLDAAYEYLLESPNTIAILSGGKGDGENISEARAMAEYLENKGLPGERMILEDRSRNTYENILFSREKVDLKDAFVVVTTNNFHVFRSVMIAKKQGLTRVEGLGAKTLWFTVPNLYLREAAAILKYAVCGQI